MYVKILNQRMNHHGFQYKEGLNVDTVPFNPSGDCEPGGLYYSTAEHICKFSAYGCSIADVIVPEDSQVYQNGTKFKADKIILSNIRSMEMYIDSLPYEKQLNAVKQTGRLLQFVSIQTSEICLEAVKQNGIALSYVKEQTDEICMVAVKQNGMALLYVNNQTPEICLEAVRQNGISLLNVKEQTVEICMEAVRQNGCALEFVKEQTPELCMETVKQNGRVKKCEEPNS